uniref:Selenoprotein P N-terminal domain-containing protein n=1 Tax=Astyanax mexicanus TaxID=7994 RepID=A0A8B9L3N3_ASTMX
LLSNYKKQFKYCIIYKEHCGQLTFHIVLPYSYLHHPYVEAAIRATYHRDICNCTVSIYLLISLKMNPSQISEEPPADPARPVNGHHHHSQTHGHYHPTHSHPHHLPKYKCLGLSHSREVIVAPC